MSSVLFLLVISLPLRFLQVFFPRVSWWSFIEVWVAANLPVSPGLSAVFWPILTMLLFYVHCLSSDFQLFNSPYQNCGDRSKRTNYNWYLNYIQVPLLSYSLRVFHISVTRWSSFESPFVFLFPSHLVFLSIPREFFTPMLADCLSLESKWQQVSSNFLEISLYSGRC